MTGRKADLPHSSRQRQRRRSAERLGRLSEHLAALYLLLKGYRIVARRHRNRAGEIDIIARRGRLIAFVEVKARAGVQDGVDAVSHASRHRIEAASLVWLASQPNRTGFSLRYDILVIRPWRLPVHLRDAF